MFVAGRQEVSNEEEERNISEQPNRGSVVATRRGGIFESFFCDSGILGMQSVDRFSAAFAAAWCC